MQKGMAVLLSEGSVRSLFRDTQTCNLDCILLTCKRWQLRHRHSKQGVEATQRMGGLILSPRGRWSRKEEDHIWEEEGKFILCHDLFNSLLEMTISQERTCYIIKDSLSSSWAPDFDSNVSSFEFFDTSHYVELITRCLRRLINARWHIMLASSSPQIALKRRSSLLLFSFYFLCAPNPN